MEIIAEKAAMPGPDDDDASEGAGVDDARAREVDEAHVFEPAFGSADAERASKAAPSPVTAERIHDGSEQRGIDEVADEFRALGHRAADDGADGVGEDDLEEPKGPQLVIRGRLESQKESVPI